MAYSLETSSVKTIVPGAEVSGFCDVVARQKINELSATVPQLSAGEGIDISTVDGKTVITNNISAGENISLVYDMETNTYRIDGQGGGSIIDISGYTLTPGNGINFVLDEPNSALYVNANDPSDNSLSVLKTQTQCGIGYCSANAGSESLCQGGIGVKASKQSFAQGWYAVANTASLAQGYKVRAETNSIAQGRESTAQNCSQTFGVGLYSTNSGMAIGTYNNISTASFVVGNGTDSANKSDIFVIYHDGRISAAGKISANGVELGAGGGDIFPITGTDDTINYTAYCDCSSLYFTTAQSPAGANTTMTVRGVHYQAYPATDVSASWFNIINAANNIYVTCSSVKLSTATDTNTFVTSALPNLNEMTFIAPSYGPYETYSALIDDGDTIFCAEVDSGCCMKVVRSWNDDRNKDCWCGLPQESYFYIG